MYELDNTTTYRIIFALSIALLLHTLAGLALSHYQWPLPEPPQTVEFELVRSGTPAPTPTAATKASIANPVATQTPEGSTEPDKAQPIVTPKIKTVAKSRTIETAEKHRPHPTPQAHEAHEAVAKPLPPKAETAPSRPSTERQAVAAAAPSGEQTLASDKGTTRGITQLTTHSGKPLSAYEKVLWAHIAERIKFAPFMQNLDQVRTVRLELTLMSNGTLERVRVIDSSKDVAVDKAAKHATIMASPYPPPPETERDNGYRFQVELQFTPANS